MKKAIFLLLVVFTFGQTAHLHAQDATSQDPKAPRVLRDADLAYSLQQYSVAIAQYEKAYKKVKERSEKAEISYRLGECYRYTFEYKKAGVQYLRALKFKKETPEVYLGIAEMLHYQYENDASLYNDVVKAYQELLAAYPNNEEGKLGLQSIQDAQAWKEAEKTSRIRVKPVNSINSEGLEFGIGFSGRPNTPQQFSEIYYTRMDVPKGRGKVDGATGMQPSDIWQATLSPLGGGGDVPKRGRSRGRGKKGPAVSGLDMEATNIVLLEAGEAINTKFAEGSPVFDQRGRTLYFTRCIKKNQSQLGCAIYSTRKAGLNWQEPQLELSAPDSSNSIGHPAISADDQTLYFAGDLEGSVEGSKDLWMAKRDRRAKGWGEPVNLGSYVNTPGNELFPFVHDDGYLYFASDGLPGMGGLDIYRVKLDEDGMPAGEAENLKAPINSVMDDFGIIIESNESGRFDGYFVTNRNERQRDDIWRFIELPITYQIRGTLSSSKDGNEKIAGAAVKLTGSDGSSHVVQTQKDGSFLFETELFKGIGDLTYELSFEKKKFLNSGATASTVGLDEKAARDTTFKIDYLNPDRETSVKMHTVVVHATMDPIEIPIILPDVYFAVAKWDLNADAQASLDMVVKTMTLNPNIVIELRSHTDYTDVDERNQILSQHRADTSVSYLISQGVDPDRLVAVGMGESQPFEIPEGYKGLGSDIFPVGTKLTEQNIRRMPSSQQDVANQINRRTDFRVIRDDYVPPVDSAALAEKSAEKVEESKPVIGALYTVGEKESWATICRNNSIVLGDLKRINGGLRGVRPFPGMVLKVTLNGDYTEFDRTHRMVTSGETFKTIAKELGMRPRELEALNPEFERDLPVGAYIRIQ